MKCGPRYSSVPLTCGAINMYIIGERAERARHYLGNTIENWGYLFVIERVTIRGRQLKIGYMICNARGSLPRRWGL